MYGYKLLVGGLWGVFLFFCLRVWKCGKIVVLCFFGVGLNWFF